MWRGVIVRYTQVKRSGRIVTLEGFGVKKLKKTMTKNSKILIYYKLAGGGRQGPVFFSFFFFGRPKETKKILGQENKVLCST